MLQLPRIIFSSCNRLRSLPHRRLSSINVLSHTYKQDQTFIPQVPTHSARRFCTTNPASQTYQGDGKTTMTALNKEHKDIILLSGLSHNGFRLNNGIFVVGPCAAFPRTVLQWNIASYEDISPQSLSLFTLLEPKIDILVIGTGNKRVIPKKETLVFIKERKINVEILSTEDAIATFNFLNVEGRCVAGAFIPPDHISSYDDEIELIDQYNHIGPAGFLS